MTPVDYDQAIEGLLHRWMGVPTGISPQRFQRGYRILMAVQILVAGLFFWIAS